VPVARRNGRTFFSGTGGAYFCHGAAVPSGLSSPSGGKVVTSVEGPGCWSWLPRANGQDTPQNAYGEMADGIPS
jgi:hypothetical protein